MNEEKYREKCNMLWTHTNYAKIPHYEIKYTPIPIFCIIL
jgi:hypothetical protein